MAEAKTNKKDGLDIFLDILMMIILVILPWIFLILFSPVVLITQGIYWFVNRKLNSKMKWWLMTVGLVVLIGVIIAITCFFQLVNWNVIDIGHYKNFKIKSRIFIDFYLFMAKWFVLFVIGYALIDWFIYYITKFYLDDIELKKKNYQKSGEYSGLTIYINKVVRKFTLIDNILEFKRKKIRPIKYNLETEIYLGRNEKNNDFSLNHKELEHHCLLIGGTGYGKTSTMLSIVEQLVDKFKEKTIIIDGKGASDLIDKVEAMGKKVFVWKLGGLNRYNFISSSNKNAVADKLIKLVPNDVVFFKNRAKHFLLILLDVLKKQKESINLNKIIEYFNIDKLQRLVVAGSDDYWTLVNFDYKDIRALRDILGITYRQLKDNMDLKTDLRLLVKNYDVILFSLESLHTQELAEAVGKMLIQDLKIFTKNHNQNTILNVFLDEFNVFANNEIENLINKTRSFGYRLFLSFQSTADLKKYDENLKDIVFANVSNLIIHRINETQDAEYLAKTLGTYTHNQYTHQINKTEQDSTMGSIRENEKFYINPNIFKQLSKGEAILCLNNDKKQIKEKIKIKRYKIDFN